MQHDPSQWTHKCVHTLSVEGNQGGGRVCVAINVGKPSCRTVGPDGRHHFPDHAAVSARVWRAAGGCEAVARLIEQDMDLHLLKAEDVPAFSDRPHAFALLLTALAEVHANASMFGGMESTGFKIKWKHVDKRGRAILKHRRTKEDLPLAA